MTEYTIVNGKIEKLNTCRIFREKSFASKLTSKNKKKQER